MPTAARSPAATASTTEEGPLTASPPAKIHFSEVCPVTGLTWMKSSLRVSRVTFAAERLEVERLADGHQHLVGLDDEGLAAFLGPAAAGAVERAQPHGDALEPGNAAALGDDLHRRGQQPQQDAFALGFLDFFLVGRHGLAAAAIDHGDVARRPGGTAVRAASMAELPPPMTTTSLPTGTEPRRL